jgi:hypothetical protein
MKQRRFSMAKKARAILTVRDIRDQDPLTRKALAQWLRDEAVWLLKNADGCASCYRARFF